MLISSTANPRLKALLALRRRRERERSRRMLVEGFEELDLAMDSGCSPLALFYSPELVRAPDQLRLLERVRERGAEVFEVSRRVFEHVAYRESPDGWLAELPLISAELDGLRLGPNPLLLVCDGIEKPGNLGAMLRTADAAGLDAVITSPAVTDWGNPNIVRASRGTVFAVPVAEAAPEQALAWLRRQGVAVVVSTPKASTAFTAADLGGRLAVVVGAENQGLSATWRRGADLHVSIPMRGRSNSLNVATSAALLVYEALRQRERRQN